MAWMAAHSACLVCRNIFSYNPDLVPSIRVNAKGEPDANGTREPICESCVHRANRLRAAKGLPTIPILEGAYDPQEVA